MAGPTNGHASTNDSTTTTDMLGTNGSATTTQGLSADEIALYDRQIRLWGAQAQERIRSANVLLVSLRALGTEIAKNLTLAGIRSLTIIDDEPITDNDLGAQFFIREEDIGRPRAEAAIPRIQELNPRVTVRSSGSLVELLGQDQTYYQPFDIVIACDHDFYILSTINTAARVAGRPFYAAALHGFYGFIFADLVAHDFLIQRARSNIPTALGPEPGSLTRSIINVTTKKEAGRNDEIVTKRELYCPLLLANSSPLPPSMLSSPRALKAVTPLLPCLRALFDFQRTPLRQHTHTLTGAAAFTTLAMAKARELQLPAETLQPDFLRAFLQNLGAEMAPVAAFVGGRLAEDALNVLGLREQPIQNFALFDGEGVAGPVYSLFTPPPEMGRVRGAGAMGRGEGVPRVAGVAAAADVVALY